MLCVIATAMTAIACGSDSSVTTGPTQVKCQVTLSSSVSTVGADGGAGSVTVAAEPECPWDASSAAAWLSGLSPTAGQGPGTVTFRAAPNPAPSSREAEIVVNDARVRVAQEAAPCVFDVQPGAISVGAGGGRTSTTVAVLGGCTWTAAADVPWIRVVGPANGSGPGTITVDVTPNDGPSARSGTLVVGTQRVTITQDGVVANPPPPPPPPPPGCTYSLGAAAASLGAGGGVTTFTVAAGPACPWAATTIDPWITVSGGAAGTGGGTVTLTVAPNPGSARTGTVAVAGQTFTVTQASGTPSCTYSLGASSVPIAAAGDAGSVAVSTMSSCAWTASSTAPWIAIASGASGTGNGVVTFSVAANSGAARTGTLVVAGQTFTVSQAAAPPSCTYALASSTVAIGASGGPGNVGVSAPGGCAWTAVSGVPWIAISAGTSGSGDGTVAFDVAANPGAARTGTLTVGGQTFTVTQAAAAPSCSYGVSTTATTVPAGGGASTVGVTAGNGCTWTAASNAPWITITSGASGSGNGSVAFDVAANTGPARSATVTVAGQSVTVSQPAGAPACTFGLGATTADLAATGGSGTVGVTAPAGCAWTSSSNAAWISVTAGASGSGDGSVGFLVAANTGAARTGTITIAGQTFTVNQQAAAPPPPPPACTFSLNPTSVTVKPKDDSTRAFTVVTAPGCAWTATSQDNWIRIESGASGSGTGSVVLDISKSPGKRDRTGTVTAAGLTFTVFQKD